MIDRTHTRAQAALINEWLSPDNGQDRFRMIYAESMAECRICSKRVTGAGLPDHNRDVHKIGAVA